MSVGLSITLSCCNARYSARVASNTSCRSNFVFIALHRRLIQTELHCPLMVQHLVYIIGYVSPVQDWTARKNQFPKSSTRFIISCLHLYLPSEYSVPVYS